MTLINKTERAGSDWTAATARAVVFAAVALAVSSAAQAAGCPPEQFYKGQEPRLTVPTLARDSRTLCSSFFSVLYSGVSRTPLYSASHLTAASVEQAEAQTRLNSFHADRRLAYGEGPALSDYAHSGFDRGHMFPNGDAPDRNSQYESFALTNMVPQNPQNNRHLWAEIESATRQMARSSGEAYVVTGPAFLGQVNRIGNVAVPNYLWKAVFFPRAGRSGVAGAWFTPNAAGRSYEVLSIDELTKRVGVDPFPGVSASVKAAGATFSKPVPYRSARDDS